MSLLSVTQRWPATYQCRFTALPTFVPVLQLLSEGELEQLLDRSHVFADDLASGADAGDLRFTNLCCACVWNVAAQWLIRSRVAAEGALLRPMQGGFAMLRSSPWTH